MLKSEPTGTVYTANTVEYWKLKWNKINLTCCTIGLAGGHYEDLEKNYFMHSVNYKRHDAVVLVEHIP